MAVKALNLSQERVYVLKDDPCRGPNGEPVDGSTIFNLRTLNGYETARLKDAQINYKPTVDAEGQVVDSKMEFAVYSPAYEACRLGLTGWSNFQDQEGNQVSFATEGIIVGGSVLQVVTKACLERLPVDYAFELMKVITGDATLSGADAKKSVAGSSPGNYTQNANAANATTPAGNNGAATQ